MRFYNKYCFQKGLNGPTTLNKSQDIGINVTGCRIFNISVKMAGFKVPFMKNVSGIGRVKPQLLSLMSQCWLQMFHFNIRMSDNRSGYIKHKH